MITIPSASHAAAAVLLATCACAPSPVADTPETALAQRQHHNYAESALISPTRVFGDVNTFGFIQHVAVLDDFVAVFDYRPVTQPEQLLVFSRTSGQVVHRLARRGQGPGEALAARSLSTLPGPGQRLALLDPSNSRLLLWDFDDVGAPPVIAVQQIEAQEMLDLAWLSRTRYVANGLNYRFELLRFYDFDLGERSTAFDRAVATDWFPEESPLVAAQLSLNVIAARPDGEYFVVASQDFNRLEIFDREGRSRRVFGGPEEITPRFEVEGGTFVRRSYDDGYQAAYVAVSAGPDRIYALFSGRAGEEVGMADEVHVFDWQGGLQKVLGLAEPVAYADLDVNSGKLFGSRLLPYPAVLEYDLAARLPYGTLEE